MPHVSAVPMFYAREARGALTGQLQDASAGLQKAVDASGQLWAWNPVVTPPQWQRVHELAAGETIWNLLLDWYGTRSIDLVHKVRDVPQNTPILGGDAAQAYPGDVILVPDLEQPWATAPSGGGTTTTTGGTPVSNGGTTNGGTTNGNGGTTNGGTTNGGTNGGTTNGNGAIATNGEAAGWWTPGKKVAAAAAGVGAAALIGWLIMRNR